MKNKRTAGTIIDDTPKVEEWEHKLTVDKYLENLRTYKERMKVWAENKGKCYYLVLQHCPTELKTELKNLTCWETALSGISIFALLIIIKNPMHNTKEQTHNTMCLVESNRTLYTQQRWTEMMDEKDTLDKYCNVFKAHVDTIKAHDGNPGYHRAVPLQQDSSIIFRAFRAPTCDIF